MQSARQVVGMSLARQRHIGCASEACPRVVVWRCRIISTTTSTTAAAQTMIIAVNDAVVVVAAVVDVLELGRPLVPGERVSPSSSATRAHTAPQRSHSAAAVAPRWRRMLTLGLTSS